MNFKVKSQLADSRLLSRTITRLAHEIVERNRGTENLCIVGIRTRGEFLGKRIVAKIQEIEGVEIPFGVLDVVMYRDDYRTQMRIPTVEVTDIPFDVDNKNLVLVDDVIFTGRTVRAAMDALIDLGRPACIQLAVLVDRGHREMPIKADFIGKNYPTGEDQEIRVKMSEYDEGEDEILLVEATE